MNDFLSHLLERAHASAPVLERRRPSIFEATAETESEALSSLGGEVDSVDLESSVPNETLPPAPSRDHPLRRATIAPAEEEHEIATDGPARRRPVADNPGVKPPPLLPNESREKPPARSPAQPERVEREATPPLRIVEQISATEPAPARPLPRPPSLTPVSARKGERETQSAPRQKPKREATDLAPNSPPNIQITIGRLEIRATTPPPAVAARPRPTSPRLSLDDYLRARSGGRR
jgi:hypothetical protein